MLKEEGGYSHVGCAMDPKAFIVAGLEGFNEALKVFLGRPRKDDGELDLSASLKHDQMRVAK